MKIKQKLIKFKKTIVNLRTNKELKKFGDNKTKRWKTTNKIELMNT